MGFRFYKRIRIAKGVSMNLSKSGPSFSFGVRGARLTVGKRPRATVSAPGTGVSYTTSLRPGRSRSTGMDRAPELPASIIGCLLPLALLLGLMFVRSCASLSSAPSVSQTAPVVRPRAAPVAAVKPPSEPEPVFQDYQPPDSPMDQSSAPRRQPPMQAPPNPYAYPYNGPPYRGYDGADDGGTDGRYNPSAPSERTQHVRGYYRNGRYVRPYKRRPARR